MKRTRPRLPAFRPGRAGRRAPPAPPPWLPQTELQPPPPVLDQIAAIAGELHRPDL